MASKEEPGTTSRTHGYEFVWTDQHPRVDDIRKSLYTYDKLANDTLERLDILSPPTKEAPKGCPIGSRDMYGLLERHAQSDEIVGQMWGQVMNVPDWVDWEQIGRGQKLAYQYYPQILIGLSLSSLVGGAGAWRIAETLLRTGGFGVNVCRRRLLETLQHFMEVIECPDSVKPNGKGFVSSVRVRLLHANVRRRIMRLQKQRPEYYDMTLWGVPINDLHQTATIMAYSVTLIYISLPRVGIYFSEQQATDYMALWRWVGYIMGTPVDWMATPAAAKAMMETIWVSEVEPSVNSQILSNNILSAVAGAPPLFASKPLLTALTYRYNGDELGAALRIDAPNRWYRTLAALLGAMLNVLSLSYQMLPESWQARRDRIYARFTNNMVTNRKFGGLGASTTFEFQYMPEIGHVTETGTTNSSSRQRAMGSFLSTLILFGGVVFLYM